MPKTSASAARRAEALERRRKAIELRRSGASYSQIANLMGISKSAAHKTVTAALEALRDELRDQAGYRKH